MAKSLEELAREAVRLQLEYRSPRKAQALLKVLSKNTSDKPRGASTSGVKAESRAARFSDGQA